MNIPNKKLTVIGEAGETKTALVFPIKSIWKSLTIQGNTLTGFGLIIAVTELIIKLAVKPMEMLLEDGNIELKLLIPSYGAIALGLFLSYVGRLRKGDLVVRMIDEDTKDE